ncbi:hypothetical protein STRMA_0489 [Streptococcus macacae NCTC 11558]|uniref:Uncharacterized protein n=1 Tax=Streptococcus macacae NCTC 11558 TaxID=764298 RepID=G5JZ71_9STRE|nr:hypothetical protein STRMA_0489 [Streptococcus macacae NCTC 11558]
MVLRSSNAQASSVAALASNYSMEFRRHKKKVGFSANLFSYIY